MSFRGCTHCDYADYCEYTECPECGEGKMWILKECDVCGKWCFAKDEFDEHRREHFDGYQFPCCKCGHIIKQVVIDKCPKCGAIDP